MRVLLALNSSEKEEEKIVQTYKEKYGETIEVTSVYFFKSLIDTVKKSAPFDRIVIHENLEPTGRKNKDVFDEYIFKNIDALTDESGNATIIFLCNSSRKRDDRLLNKMFNIGIYNILIGEEGTFSRVCELIKNPMTKKDAKRILEVDLNTETYEDPNKVSEIELRNILEYFEKNKNNKDSIISGFDNNLYQQYTMQKLRVIIKVLPEQVRKVLYENSDKYRAVLNEPLKIVEVPVYFEQNKGQTISKPKRGLFSGLLKKEKRLNSNMTQETNSNSELETNQNIKSNAPSEFKPIYKTEKPNVIVEVKEEKQNSNNVNIELTQDIKDILDLTEQEKKEMIADFSMPQVPKIEQITIDSLNKEVVAKESKEEMPVVNIEEPEKTKEEEIVVTEEAIPLVNIEIQEEPKEEVPVVNEEPEEEIPLVNIEIPEEPKEETPVVDEVPEEEIPLVNIEIPEEPKEEVPVVNEVPEEEIPLVNIEVPEEPKEETPLVNIEIPEEPKEETPSVNIEVPEEQITEILELTNNLEEKLDEKPIVKVEISEETKETPIVNIPEQVDNVRADRSNDNFNNTLRNNGPQIQTVTQVIEREVIKEVYETPSDYKKTVAFIGAHKVGTTFVVNAIANNLTAKGIKTAILDLTKNKDTYKIYAANSSEYRDIAGHSIPNLAIGQDVPLKLGDLSIYTGIPRVDRTKLDSMRALEKIRSQNAVILIDCDFTTNIDIFRLVSNIFVVQDMDTLNILDITSFLKELKVRDIDLDKVEVIVNKYMKSVLSVGKIVESLSYYTNPEMTFVNELLSSTVERFVIPFDEQNYLRYIESLYSAKLNYDGFSEEFKQAIASIVYDIFPISSTADISAQQQIIKTNNSGLMGIFKKKK